MEVPTLHQSPVEDSYTSRSLPTGRPPSSHILSPLSETHWHPINRPEPPNALSFTLGNSQSPISLDSLLHPLSSQTRDSDLGQFPASANILYFILGYFFGLAYILYTAILPSFSPEKRKHE